MYMYMHKIPIDYRYNALPMGQTALAGHKTINFPKVKYMYMYVDYMYMYHMHSYYSIMNADDTKYNVHVHVAME